MDQPTSDQPASTPTMAASTGVPRWLRVTAISAAVAAVLALAGVATVARGGLGEHRAERMAMATVLGHELGRGGPMSGPAGQRGRFERAAGPRGEGRAEHRAERRADAMAARQEELAATLGVDPADLAAALEAGRAAGRETALATAAEALGIDVARLEAALTELAPGRHAEETDDAEDAA